jgi:4-amino-4-deoxy-L-arabinose transferase-like glycosyltransferase
MQDSLGHDFLAKILEGQEDHGAPPGTYLLSTPLLLWPMSWLIIPYGWRALRSPEPRQRMVTSFAFGWLVLPWILFELVPTKLPHYVLPLLPALCLLAGMGMFSANQKDSDIRRLSSWPRRIGMAAWYLSGSALVIGIPALSVLANGGISMLSGLIALLCIVVITALPKIVSSTDRLIASAVASVAVFGLIFEVFLPRLAPVWPAESLRSAIHSKDLPVAISGYHEPSVVFNLGTKTQTTTLEGVVDHSLRHPEAIAIFPYDELSMFRVATLGRLQVQLLDQVKGINYSKGRKINLVIAKTSLIRVRANPESEESFPPTVDLKS